MAKVQVAAFLIQDASSPRQKVYGSIVWLDPASGEAHMASGFGPYAHLGRKLLRLVNDHGAQTTNPRSRPAISHRPAAVATAFADRYHEKAHGGYTTTLGGPVVVEVDSNVLTDSVIHPGFSGELRL